MLAKLGREPNRGIYVDQIEITKVAKKAADTSTVVQGPAPEASGEVAGGRGGGRGGARIPEGGSSEEPGGRGGRGGGPVEPAIPACPLV